VAPGAEIATLHVLGSGSKGNAFALVHAGATLLVEAGFSARELERRLLAAGLAPTAVVGIALTHEHGDHAMGAVRFAARHDIPLVSSLGTWRALARGGEPCAWLPTGSRGEAAVGPFQVAACPCSHDAAEPVALGVTCADGTRLAVATDLGRPTQAIRWFLRERHALVLEANHDEVLLRQSGYPPVVQQRIAGHGGHLSNDACAELLAEVHHDGLGTVVLAHLSQRCNSPDVARGAIEPALRRAGFRGALHCSTQDGPMAPIRMPGPGQVALL
jgi:phosphoribosyl 1,2-cyclic phosphodiesterase